MRIPVISCAAIVDAFCGIKDPSYIGYVIMFNFFQVKYVYSVWLCADNNVSHAATIQFQCGYQLFTFRLFLFTESAPLHIRGLIPGFVQAAIDHLNTSDLYTTKLLCGRYEPPDKQQPGSSEPAHETRSSEKKKPDLIKEAMGFSSYIRGKMPKPFSSKAVAEAEASRGAAKDFSLSNTHQLAMLTNYLYLNGKYDLCSTPKDESCLFSACKWGADFPVEYVNTLFRRDLVCFIAENADFFSQKWKITSKAAMVELDFKRRSMNKRRRPRPSQSLKRRNTITQVPSPLRNIWNTSCKTQPGERSCSLWQCLSGSSLSLWCMGRV